MPKNAGNLIFWGACPQTPQGASAFGTCDRAPSAPSMLQYKSPLFSLGFPVFQSPSTSFNKVRVGGPETLIKAAPGLRQFLPELRGLA